VKLVVPFPPGGVTDGVARIAAEWLSSRLPHPVVAENKPGASGAIAAEQVARAAPDGHTLFMASASQLAVLPHTQTVSYDPLTDFAPVSIVGANPFALGVNDEIPGRTLKEFIEHVKSRPGELSYASAGSGTVSHLTMELFLARAGLRMQHVNYKGGGPATADLMGRHIPAYFGNLNELIPHARSGKIKVLAVSGSQRAPQLPDTPTVAEQGYPGFRTVTWNGIAAPAGTPAAIVERLAREIGAGCRDAQFAERLASIGVDPVCNTPADFAGTLREDLRLWGEAVRAAGIQPAQ